MCCCSAKVLDVGSGSGYLCACFGHMVGETGKVIGIDRYRGFLPHLMSLTLRLESQLVLTFL